MKDPAILFYTSDFLTGVSLLSNEQVGKYIKLLCYQHQKGHLSEKDMLKICISYDEDIFEKFKKDDLGNYYNDRLELEINKRKAYSLSRSNNRKGAKIKDKKHKKNISKTYVKHMENENKDINEDENNIEILKPENLQKKIKDASLHKEVVGIYFGFYESLNGVKPQFDKSDGEAVKTLITYFRSISTNKTDEEVIELFKHLFDKYDKWGDFYKKMIRPRQFGSNIANIINNIKNDNTNTSSRWKKLQSLH